MHIFKASLQLLLGAALCLLGITTAFAEYEPNDNYSKLLLSYQSSKFAEPVCIDTVSGSECHEGVAGPAAIYARQIIPNLALGVAGSYLQSSGNASSIKSSNGSVFVQGIVGLGSSVDVGASVAALRTTLQRCISNTDACNSSSDSGTDVGVFGKVFLNNAKSVSATLSYNTISFQKSENQSIVALSLVTILEKRHRLALSVDRSINANGTSVSGGYVFGYSYLAL